MRSIVTVVALCLVASTAQAQTPSTALRANSVEEIVLTRVRSFFVGMGKGQLPVIEDALAQDYLVIGGDGKLETRAERLAWLRGNFNKLGGVTPSELRVRPYGNTAVVTGKVTISEGANVPPIEERFTQVWVRRDAVWRMVTSQITIVKK
ncbi:MAG: nuclear transport factor 2 family protein [bacterium]